VRILVTGAAGYIGSVVTERLLNAGDTVVALDNLSNGHADAVDRRAEFLKIDLLDRDHVFETFRRTRFDAVVHLAAEALIDVSVRDPGRFFRANVVAGINLVDAMIAAGVTKLVFSSTAAVYGEPRAVPIEEEADYQPVNAYGESKLAFERMLPWYERAHGLAHVSFRYFNACGATEQCGERHEPETHLIPIVLDVAQGLRSSMQLFGADYDTPDGTCVRDYVHVVDIADAHILALRNIGRIPSTAFNLGNGHGYTNRQVIDAVERVTGRSIRFDVAPRRAGDPARLVASGERARTMLGWSPSIPDLESMVATAWQWRMSHPQPHAASR
jgi:UDP-glucose 4-epimerase